jgi:hypothetical protein
VCIYRQVYIILPGPKIPYTPGWHHSLSPFGAPLPGHAIPKSKHAPGALGYVTPVMQSYVNIVDHWVWLEYLWFKRETVSANRAKTEWVPLDLPEQWDLWYEYD